MQSRFQQTPRPSSDQFLQSSGILERNFSHYMPFVFLILSDDFVGAALDAFNRQVALPIPNKNEVEVLEGLIEKALHHFRIDREDFVAWGRAPRLSKARGLFAYWALSEFGISTVAGYLGVSRQAVTKAIKRGQQYARDNCLAGRHV